ncbi:MAG: molybdopterin-dependent oxidoreductase, partial [Gammaproteobacteria bacterium]
MSVTTTKTTCPYCGVGCGVIVTMHESGCVEVQGDTDHPSNYGRLCSKGSALGETVHLAERLLYPEIHGEQVSWEQAYSAIASKFSDVIEQHGPDAVAFYVSGQLLTEDYYVANKLMKGFIGSANIDTNSRLCMSSVVAAYKRAFGEDVMPCNYDDLERAQLIVLTGTNTAWCHPVLYQRIARSKELNPNVKIISIDPRRTQTSDISDLHLSIRPGTDAILFNGLLVWLQAAGEIDQQFVSTSTEGVEQALQSASLSSADINIVAEACALDIDEVEQFYRLFARTERVVTVFSQGINQSSSGVDKINSIINCHLLTGRIGRKGMGPFSLTGQPNAMGGREVGGLANQLVSHMEIENKTHREIVAEFWQTSTLATKAGFKAIDCFDEIEKKNIRAIWIMATNPVVSMPDADRVKAALEGCEFVVVSDCVRDTDTSKLADVCLPATTWGERDGTVTSSERRISRQRPFLTAPGLAKHDWQIITELAQKMGHEEAFPYRSAAEIFDEYAKLTAYKKDTYRQLDLSGLTDMTLYEYNELHPVQWPVYDRQLSSGNSSMYSDGRFSTENRRARFIAITPRPPAASVSEQFPFILNTGRIRDQWHTMTRTGMSPRLSTHRIEPFVEIHPDDAARVGITDGKLAQISSETGAEILVRVRASDRQQRGSLFVPMHWNLQFSGQARVDSLIKTVVDPISGQPEFKHAVASIKLCDARWYGFIISRQKPALKYSRYWARSRGKGFWRYEIAGQEQPEDWAIHAKTLLNVEQDEEWAEFYDKADGHYRAARFVAGHLDSVIFIDSSILLPPRDWLISLFQKDQISAKERSGLLQGTPPAEVEDVGKIICACFNVGEKTIYKAVNEAGAENVEAVGKICQAGTNCGSCKPEINALVRECL